MQTKYLLEVKQEYMNVKISENYHKKSPQNSQILELLELSELTDKEAELVVGAWGGGGSGGSGSGGSGWDSYGGDTWVGGSIPNNCHVESSIEL